MAYTTIDDPSAHFQTVLYTGSDDASATKVVTNDGNSDLQPDWLWFKRRNASVNHAIQDTSRGIGNGISSSTNGAEVNDDYGVTAISSDGFSVRENAQAAGEINQGSMVCWQWKANGGTTTTNDASATSVGTIDSVYQANTTAGFSIVTYTGTGSAGTIAHGLGVVPASLIIKRRDSNDDWCVYHHNNTSSPEEVFQKLSQTVTTNGTTSSNASLVFNDTAPTSSVFSVGTSTGTNANTGTYVAYCFAEKKGYSKFGSYTGNGSTDGPFVYTGFKPAFTIGKKTSGADNWYLMDTKRLPFNSSDGDRVFPNLSNAESTDGPRIDFVSNGFKIKTDAGLFNDSGATYIYFAFAEHPFVSSKGVPVTAR